MRLSLPRELPPGADLRPFFLLLHQIVRDTVVGGLNRLNRNKDTVEPTPAFTV